MKIALIGNPNTGKTSLFNALTGSYEYVGNWSGVTVEKKIGQLKHIQGDLIDLPGVYSLHPLSKDETVVTHFLLEEDCDALINILDASQLRRHLQLTLQLLEYNKPIVIGLNMMDVAKQRGIEVDVKELSRLLNTSVNPIDARKEQGVDTLTTAIEAKALHVKDTFTLDYGLDIEKAITELQHILPDTLINPRWLILQYFDDNPVVTDYLKTLPDFEIYEAIKLTLNELCETKATQSLSRQLFHVRNQFIGQLLNKIITTKKQQKPPLTETIDRLATNRFLGIPIFLGLLYVMFMLTFDWLGFPLSDMLDAFFSGPLTTVVLSILDAIDASIFIRSLILEGIIGGVFGVLVFVPQIFILFFFISLLEDSGYMARVATVMDRIMQGVGLSGKSFIPMIIGFGCNVPGVMAARTIEQPKERLLTILLTPLMSCSARLPVYALFASAFFSEYQALVVLSLYVLGVVLALLLAKLFSSTFYQADTSFFIVELPPYRFPQWKTLWRSTWEKGKGFVRKAGTFIFAGSVFIWLLTYIGPEGFNVPMDESFLALIGGFISPVLSPLGFGTWQAAAALLTGFLAKEVVVSTMAIIYAVPEAGLHDVLLQAFSPLSAYSFMVFILLYVPCLATVAVIGKETQSKRLALFSVIYALVLAYVLSFIIYQAGQLFI